MRRFANVVLVASLLLSGFGAAHAAEVIALGPQATGLELEDADGGPGVEVLVGAGGRSGRRRAGVR